MGASAALPGFRGALIPDLGALIASGWETPQDFFVLVTHALKTPTGKVFQPPSASMAVCPSAALCSLGITDLWWDRPHAHPQPWECCQHLWFPWQLQNAKYGAGAHHSIASFPWLLQKWVAGAGAAHRTLCVGHSAWPDPAAGSLSQNHCAGRELFHPPEKHTRIFLAGQQDKRAQLFQPSICFMCSRPHSLSK